MDWSGKLLGRRTAGNATVNLVLPFAAVHEVHTVLFSNLIYLAFYASMAKAFAGKTAVENANLGVQGNSIGFVTCSSDV